MRAGLVTMKSFRLTIGNRLDEMSRLTSDVAAFLRSHGADPHTAYAVDLALEEMVSNVIRHGYRDDKSDGIVISVDLKSNSVLLTVEDRGRPFNPLEAPTPDLDLPVEQRRIGGLGIFLVRQTVDEMRYERVEDRNVLIMRIGRSDPP
jgi:serine/threonine-protein kinase RsbW